MKRFAGKALFTLAITAVTSTALAQSNGIQVQTEFSDVATDSSIAAHLPESYKDKGYIDLAVNPTSPPFGFYAEGGQQVVGRAVDILSAVAGKLGLEPRFHDAGGFDNLIPGLVTHRYDAVAANMYVRPDRLQRVDFVDYFKVDRLALVMGSTQSQSEETYTSLAELCGLTIAAGSGTTNATDLDKQSERCIAEGKKPIEVPLFPDRASGVQAVLSHRVPGFFGPYEGLQYQSDVSRGRLRIAGVFSIPQQNVAIGLAKDSELTDSVKDAVNSLISDGTYQKILEKWNIEYGAISKAESNESILDD